MANPTLYIPRKIYQKLMHWVDKSNFEVSWFGVIRYDKKENYFVVDEIFLLEQENSSAETEIKAAALCDLLYDTAKMEGDLRWWGHCLTEDVQILMSNGEIVSAKELFESLSMDPLTNKVLNQKFVISKNQNDQFVKSQIAKAKIIKNAKCLSIKTSLNREISCSLDHKLWTKNGWEKASLLKEGDLIGIPGNTNFSLEESVILPEYIEKQDGYKYSKIDNNFVEQNDWKVRIPKEMSLELAEILGWIASEGCIDRGSHHVHFCQKDVFILEHVKNLFKKVFNVDFEYYQSKTAGCPEIRLINSRPVGNFLLQLGIPEGRDPERVPPCIMRAPTIFKEKFLDSLIYGDGSLDQRGRILYKRVYSVHKKFVNDLMYLVSSIGYRAGIRTMKQNYEHHNYPIVYDVYWNSTDKVNSKIEWVKIKSINDIGERDVYAFDVPEYENFVCGFGPFISHNSHVKMGVFWSGTDMKTMKELSQNGWFLSTVFNQKREMKTAYMQGGDIPIMLDDLPTVIYDPVYEEDKKEWDKEYEKNVKIKKYSAKPSNIQIPLAGTDSVKHQKEKKISYSANEYKIINKMIAGNLSAEEFIEEWESVSEQIPPESILTRSEEGRKALKHFEEKEISESELTEGELAAWLDYIKTKDDDESKREVSLIRKLIESNMKNSKSREQPSDEEVEEFFSKLEEKSKSLRQQQKRGK